MDKILSQSKHPREAFWMGVFNLTSGEVRRVNVVLDVSPPASSFVMGFELGVGHWDNHRLLGLPDRTGASRRTAIRDE